MSELLTGPYAVIGLLLGWVVVQTFVLPRLGVST
jgi:hypothetical protein